MSPTRFSPANPPWRKNDTDSDEGYEADDESGKSQATATAFTNPPEEIRGVFYFKVHRECSKLPSSSGKVSQWIDSSYFIWNMCATLADSSTDPEWTKAFELWRPTWDQIQEELQASEDTEFPVKIPLAPVKLASVQPGNTSPRGIEDEDWVIEIEQDGDDDAMLYDNQDIWALWQRVIASPVGSTHAFHVTLQDTARICPRS
ncbi:hypothetical protein PENANT_c057G04501 [Penicillium antarcticum]|uniref:Uncharacterized protein n=1 Tax=Penicillium antarcticum TaxID=416450 RepID=A0A1V6PRB3_9EURO|nr:uncharacterized protein N7508_006846 [Penicillium antarcticum]KAJ5301983.1 hypothetical protein N7508_006846 [Penicillium antarcticum]OQD79242.1 hypothetical protein PENANT_c057G04501 [Penicillium antarcticum]